WVTTAALDGSTNAAPFSSYNYVAHSPPMLAINIGTRNGELKDTARNILETLEFVVNVVTDDLVTLMDACSADYPPGVSELKRLGIETLPGRFVKAPRIAASPIQMECRLDQAIRLGSGNNTLYIGQVLAFHLSPSVYDGRHIDAQRLRPLGRIGGPNYSRMGEIIRRQRLASDVK
ncbi:MAG: flavin reductase family protein, partial [Pseudomonadota bacterium]